MEYGVWEHDSMGVWNIRNMTIWEHRIWEYRYTGQLVH